MSSIDYFAHVPGDTDSLNSLIVYWTGGLVYTIFLGRRSVLFVCYADFPRKKKFFSLKYNEFLRTQKVSVQNTEIFSIKNRFF